MSDEENARDQDLNTNTNEFNEDTENEPNTTVPVTEKDTDQTDNNAYNDVKLSSEVKEPEARSSLENKTGPKIDATLKVFRRSIIELVGNKNWKTLFGEESRITQDPEVEKSMKRLIDIQKLYNEMSKSLAEYLFAWKQIAAAEENVGKFFSENGIYEEDHSMRAEMLNFGERHKLFTSSWQDMVVTYQTFSERTNTFLSKAIDDCFETAKKHQSIHSEHTSIQEKVVQLEAKATQDHQKFEKELNEAKAHADEVAQRYITSCQQLTSKIEILYELKVSQLKEHFQQIYQANQQQFSDVLKANEVVKMKPEPQTE